VFVSVAYSSSVAEAITVLFAIETTNGIQDLYVPYWVLGVAGVKSAVKDALASLASIPKTVDGLVREFTVQWLVNHPLKVAP
jgi:hypothetical protein